VDIYFKKNKSNITTVCIKTRFGTLGMVFTLYLWIIPKECEKEKDYANWTVPAFKSKTNERLYSWSKRKNETYLKKNGLDNGTGW